MIVLLVLIAPLVASADYVYLSKDEALRLVLGEGCAVSYEPREIPAELFERLDDEGAAPEEGAKSHLFVCRKDDRPAGYAFIDTEIGKHLPITFIVGVSPEGKVTRTEIMVYREEYGSQAKERRFMEQFDGKVVEDELRVGKDIRHVTGATLSSKAIAVGVRRNLRIWEYFFGTRAPSPAG